MLALKSQEITPILKTTLENVAERVAAASGGRITCNDLAPLLPVSLELIEKHLDDMVDDHVVFSTRHEGLKVYEFSELVDAPPRPLPRDVCLYCGADKPADNSMPVCFACHDELARELLELAGSNAWPSEAVWQHEILYITSLTREPVPVAEIAGRSRMTLKLVKKRLMDLAARGFARQEADAESGTLKYRFPPISYSRDVYLRHDRFIRLHPSSLKDEVEVKIIKSLRALAISLVCCIVVTLTGMMPLPLALVVMGVGAAIAIWRIVRSRTELEPGRIERERPANGKRKD